jgi:hypothetical protein
VDVVEGERHTLENLVAIHVVFRDAFITRGRSRV